MKKDERSMRGENGQFTVSIALIHHNTPALGMVYIPVLGETCFAKKGEGAFKEILKENSLNQRFIVR